MNVNAGLIAAAKQLIADAHSGVINTIYEAIQGEANVLEHFDQIPFIQTPLHVAASLGHIEFAMEIMKLKPSLALKLNEQGWSPIHLALQNGEWRMVFRFVEIDNDLVRVKGKEGKTPLHLASENGHITLIANFLWACPHSIKDVTVQSHTALHIAVTNNRFEALQVLVGWLKKNSMNGSAKLENRMLNWKDDEGNTILHIAASNGHLEAVGILVRTGMNLNAKNSINRTALDTAAGNDDIRNTLSRAGARAGPSVSDHPTIENNLISNISFFDKIVIFILRTRSSITDDQRDAFLIVATLVVTAIFQSSLSPPGGVYQTNAGDNNVNSTSNNSTATAKQQIVGTSIMSVLDFIGLWVYNTIQILLSTSIIFILTPSGIVRAGVCGAISFLLGSYFLNLREISPTSFLKSFNLFVMLSYVLLYDVLLWATFKNCIRYKKYADNREIRTRKNAGRKKW